MKRRQIRDMRSADLLEVALIEGASFPTPWTPGLFRGELRQGGGWRRVAVSEEGRITGYLVCRVFYDVWHVLNLAVSPAARGQGVGRSLLEEFLERAEIVPGGVTLEVRPSNGPALALYRSLGFKQQGIRRRYYDDTGEDALIMTLSSPEWESQRVRARPRPAPAGRARLLAIETSCDDTCAAVMDEEGGLLSNVVHSQDVIHEKYGGVVPEVASRAHAERATVVVREALTAAGGGLEDISAVAVTVGPGLIGALLVGVNTAKAVAWARRLPLIPVNHLHGHLGAVWLAAPDVPFPLVALIASGGHTMLVRADSHRDFRLLGQTLDDAAGEAMDKAARLLGLGYPGGRELDQLAETGDPTAFAFPIALRNADTLDFSFSGVKTAMYYLLRDMTAEERARRASDLAASYRAAVVEALAGKLFRAGARERAAAVAIGGGVAANSLLRRRVEAEGLADGYYTVIPPLRLCTDNAAMIASAARFEEAVPYPRYLALDARASLALGERLQLREQARGHA